MNSPARTPFHDEHRIDGASCLKTILCLANAAGDGGQRLAGRVVDGERLGDWIRPVSERGGLTLSTDDRQYADGAEPRPLDILTLHMSRPVPQGPYIESHLSDPNYFCRLVGRATWDQALAAVDRSHGPLWGAAASNSTDAEGSLRLIEVSNLRIERTADGANGVFSHNGLPYTLPLNDDAFLRRHEEGDVGAALLCVSLREADGGQPRPGIDGVITRAAA